MSSPVITNQPSNNNLDKDKNDKNDKNDNDDDLFSLNKLVDKPCSCSRQACKMGCDGCAQWEKHSGTDCGEILFCCLPITFVCDTIVFPYTMVKFIVEKCKK